MSSTALREAVEKALAQGDAAGALDLARRYLEHDGGAAPLECYPLLEPDVAGRSRGVRETACWQDAEVASTARFVPELPQYAKWANAFQPPVLRRFVLERCAALAPGVLLTEAGELLNDNVAYSNAELCRHFRDGFPGIAASDRQIIVALRHRETVRLARPAIYLQASRNYAEWIFGELPKLVAFAGEEELHAVLHGEPSAFHIASLAALGFAGDRLILHRPQVRIECAELHYCTTTFTRHAPSPRGMAYLRSRLGVDRGAAAPARAPRLYLARRKIANARPMLNENDLVALLERHGFLAVDPEEHPFEEQVRLAASAEVIAAPYGANLVNAMFARRARAAFIIATKGQPEFSRLMSALAIPHWHVVPAPVKVREGRILSESLGFTVDLDQAEAVLKICLSESGM